MRLVDTGEDREYQYFSIHKHAYDGTSAAPTVAPAAIGVKSSFAAGEQIFDVLKTCMVYNALARPLKDDIIENTLCATV
jgi:hypothetical protein